MCNSHSLRVIYVLCSCIDIFNLVGFVLSLCTLHVVWSSGYKTSNFSRSLHEVEVSTFMYSLVDFVLLCERGLRLALTLTLDLIPNPKPRIRLRIRFRVRNQVQV